MDAVCGQLRDEKQPALIELMTECRKHSPNLIMLNHRLNQDQPSPMPLPSSGKEPRPTSMCT